MANEKTGVITYKVINVPEDFLDILDLNKYKIIKKDKKYRVFTKNGGFSILCHLSDGRTEFKSKEDAEQFMLEFHNYFENTSYKEQYFYELEDGQKSLIKKKKNKC